MIRLIAVAGFLAFATSAQAMMPAPIPQPDGMITQVRLGCAHLGPELMVSAWPEPPSGRPAEPSAGATAGASSEHHRLKRLSITQSGAVTVPPMAVC